MQNIFDYAVVGVGAAGLSFIKESHHLKGKKILAIDKNVYSQKNHLFGFWDTVWTKELNTYSFQKWNTWSIVSQDNEVNLYSEQHPYGIIYLDTWKKVSLQNKKNLEIFENHVNSINKKNEIFEIILDNKEIYYAHNIIDSRSVKLDRKYLKQHFLGLTIETKEDVFDETKLVLMDFRVDQSRGIHFIYLVPFTKNKALVESTMFSFNEEDKEWYIQSIKNYLNKIYKLKEWKVLEEENGSIPMTLIKNSNNNFVNIGTMSGAIKPSSGYAMSFIQKQIYDLFQNPTFTYKTNINPHKKIDLWMDKIFLKVLETNPAMAINIFINLGKTLNGDEFALFMSGQANTLIRLKVVFKMPKKPFLRALFN